MANHEFEMFFNHTLALLFIATLDGTLKRINPSFKRMLGYSEHDLLETQVLDLVHPADLPLAAKEMARVANGNDTVSFICRVRSKEKAYRWIEWDCPAASGGVEYLYAAGRDITERRKAEQIREGAFHRLKSMVDGFPEAMLLVNSRGTITQSNRAAELLFGYSRNELEQSSIDLLVPDHLRDAHADLFQAFISKPSARPMGEGRALAGRHKSGKEVPVEVALTPLDTNDEPMILVAVVDIERRNQRAIQRANIEDFFSKLSASAASKSSEVHSMCSFCKNVKVSADEWINVEHWISQNFGVYFSGAYCKPCVIKNFPEFADDVINSVDGKSRT